MLPQGERSTAAAATCERQLERDIRILLPRFDRRRVSYRRQIGRGEVQDRTRSQAKASVIPQKEIMNLGESLQRDNSNLFSCQLNEIGIYILFCLLPLLGRLSIHLYVTLGLLPKGQCLSDSKPNPLLLRG